MCVIQVIGSAWNILIVLTSCFEQSYTRIDHVVV